MTALPSPYVAVVLALAAFRLTRLLGWDEFPPVVRWRDRLLRKRVGRNMTAPGDAYPVSFGRPVLAAGWTCPYCLGFWVGLVLWAVWVVAPTPAVWVAAPFALNAVVGIVARNLD